ncbi:MULTISPECIES: DUF4376 domain-containing protein [unclassified Pseudomonas]|uniref:DUF4376 domain-containing protein n=1 Tax=unclassified Pseudomonas TaxID=196821 RepID=UPI002115B591|nr:MULTISPECIES: DUF4376 domain-containing protein [unclassified Pseudomonas]
MRTYAWIYDGAVAELTETSGDISTMYHPSFLWVEVPPDIAPKVGWLAHQEDDVWSFVPPESARWSVDELRLMIAAERYRREGLGVVVAGLPIDTSRDSQSLIAGMAVSALVDSAYRCNFKTGAGFVELDAVQILEISNAVRGHVQACFDREKTLLDLIAAGTFREEMLAEGWPDSSPPEPVELQ